ncbi:MAG: acyl carrier protein [Mycoplasma sp.]
MRKTLQDEVLLEKISKLVIENGNDLVFVDCKDDFFIDLNFDSISYINLICDIESYFDVSISVNEIEDGLRNVDDVFHLLKRESWRVRNNRGKNRTTHRKKAKRFTWRRAVF